MAIVGPENVTSRVALPVRYFKISFKDAVKSLAHDIGNAVGDVIDEAARGFNAATSKAAHAIDRQLQSSQEEDSKQNTNNSESTNKSESGGQDKTAKSERQER